MINMENLFIRALNLYIKMILNRLIEEIFIMNIARVNLNVLFKAENSKEQYFLSPSLLMF